MKRSMSPKNSDYVRISLSIPREVWSFFERQCMQPLHAGNRSSYVRSLIVAEMTKNQADKTKRK
jgi:hypothetical protein